MELAILLLTQELALLELRQQIDLHIKEQAYEKLNALKPQRQVLEQEITVIIAEIDFRFQALEVTADNLQTLEELSLLRSRYDITNRLLSDKITRHYLELIAQRDQALKENDLKHWNHIKEELRRLKRDHAGLLREVNE